MKRLGLILASLSLLSLTCLPLAASADVITSVGNSDGSNPTPVTYAADSGPPSVNNFTITNFTADETLSRADPQGELHIVERIQLVFTADNHGILRSIPARYKGHSLQLHVNSITSTSGAPTAYTSYTSNGNTVLKVGDPNRTVTGAQDYTVDYTLRNIISFYKDHDELYWDVNGDQWQQPFQAVSVTLHVPASVKLSHEPVCFAGSYGNKLGLGTCSVTDVSDGLSAMTTQPLSANQTLTFVAAFDKGYFQPSPWYQTLTEQAKPLLEFVVPFLTLSIGSGIWWFKRGRDARGKGTIIAQYDAPDALKPIEVGAIMNFKVNNRDITATLIDLAIRGYVKLIETKQDRLIGKDKLSYSVQLLKIIDSNGSASEQALLRALFPAGEVSNTISINDNKHKLYTAAIAMRTQVEADLTTRGYFRSNPLTAGRTLGYVASAMFVVVYIGAKAVGVFFVAGLFIGSLIVGLFAALMSARTAKGVAAKEHAEGLKLYLEVAEKDRLEKLQGPNAAYASNAAEPVKTVNLFEKLLPFAIVLGVEKQWAGQFESLYTTPPGWYSGNWTTFNAVYLASSLNSGIGTAVNQAFSAPSNSGSSGFSGGFSGGGGGGGGGGGW